MLLPITDLKRFALALAVVSVSAVPALADRIKNPIAVFSGLDKITGRIITFEVAIDELVQFGTLQVIPKVCYTRPPTEAPQTDAFVEVVELTSTKEHNKLFSGWMFADSPGLHGVEHPVYDVWLTDCKGGKTVIATPDPNIPTEPAAPAPAPGTVPKKKKVVVDPAQAPAALQPADALPQSDPAPINVGPAPGAKLPANGVITLPADTAAKKPKTTRKIVPVDPVVAPDLDNLAPINGQ